MPAASGESQRAMTDLAARERPLARTDLAARLFGSAHALDAGTRLEAAAVRALAYWCDGHTANTDAGDGNGGGGHGGHGGHDDGETGREEPTGSRAVWERAGVHLDLTSAPALTWNLPALAGVGDLTREATRLGAPAHLSQFLLREHPVRVTNDADILVVENPRLVEAAAQLRVPHGVVATNGSPSTAVQLLLDQLLEAGAVLRYHGDFDAAGLIMCARMHDQGATPWRMHSSDYLAAVRHAESEGVTLPHDPHPAPATPWDPDLQHTFDEHRLVVHEERLLHHLFGGV